MASTSTTTRALLLSLKPFLTPHSPSPSHHLTFLSPPTTTTISLSTRRRATIIAGVGGGGLSDIRKSEFSREFSVIANMLKRIEPLDTSDVSKSVSDSAKESMKQTISTMLGLLPSDQFDVSVRVAKVPLHRLLVSSIITGYTLWNAEYRISLMRNFELSVDSTETSKGSEVLGIGCLGPECVCGEASELGLDSAEQVASHSLKGLSPEALTYIQNLEAELCSAKQELDAQKKDSKQMESDRDNNNNLLEYLRSLESYMVTELSQPSSVEVKDVIHELVHNTMHRFFKDDATSEPMENTTIGGITDHQVSDSEIFTTSRDYLAKLLFWCMLLGNHLRGLENRLHLSCVVGLL